MTANAALCSTFILSSKGGMDKIRPVVYQHCATIPSAIAVSITVRTRRGQKIIGDPLLK